MERTVIKPISIAAGCVLAFALLPGHAQMPRFKPLVESEMSEPQLKAARELGFEYRHGLREGLQRLIDWRTRTGGQ